LTGRRKQGLLALLKNVTYIGQVSYKGTIYPGEQPPVVDERLWQQVNRRLESQRWPEPQRAGKPALLKGLLRCEPCKAVMILSETRKQDRSYRYYVCGNAQRRCWRACPSQSIPAKVIEESVLEQVRKNCKLGKRHQQEHVGERLNRVLERVSYDGTTGGVTLNFRPAAGMDEPMLRYILGRVEKPEQVAERARLPRVTRSLALALKCEGLVRSGTIPDYAELARRGLVTHARFTQPSASQFNLHGLNVNSPDLPSELAGFSPTVLWQDQQNSPVNYDNNGNIVDDVSCGGFGAWPDHRRKRPALFGSCFVTIHRVDGGRLAQPMS